MPKGMPGCEARKLLRYRKEAFLRQKGACYWCGGQMVASNGARTDDRNPRLCTAEHLVPRHAGGITEPSNIVAACKKCNCERHPEFNGYKQNAAEIISA
jgi:hypothetical protein